MICRKAGISKVFGVHQKSTHKYLCKCFTDLWSLKVSNLGPSDYESDALTN